MSSLIKRFIWNAWESLAKKAARAYVSGPELDDALYSSRRLRGFGLASTVCYWNTADDSPRQVADACIATASAMALENTDVYLSIKLPAMNFDNEQLERILNEASKSQLLVHFDAHGPETADPTFAAIARAMTTHRQLGCTLPGRWERSCSDSEMAIDLGLHVRVVKGQWPDPGHPDLNLREGFLKVVDSLAGRARSVAVATHDPQVGRQALMHLLDAGTPCVLELLYGLPVSPALRLACELNVPVRVYIPFGHGWLPYTLTQARRNPQIMWWMLRDLMSGGSPFNATRLPANMRPPPTSVLQRPNA